MAEIQLSPSRPKKVARGPVPEQPSVLASLYAVAGEVLGVRKLNHWSAMHDLCSRAAIPAGSVKAIYDAIALDWHNSLTRTGGGASIQNWRWRAPQLAIGETNCSAEVMLERAIVGASERAGRVDWANQVPVASGIAGPFRERRRAIDLVHEIAPGHFELIELKVASDTPLHAAFEIIGYTCVWLLTRARQPRQSNALLDATSIDAVVLAPDAFYARHDLTRLAATLNTELAALGDAHGVALTFRFDCFPAELGQAPLDDDKIAALLDARRVL